MYRETPSTVHSNRRGDKPVRKDCRPKTMDLMRIPLALHPHRSSFRSAKSPNSSGVGLSLDLHDKLASWNESGRGLPHSKTLARHRGPIDPASAFGVRQPSGAFRDWTDSTIREVQTRRNALSVGDGSCRIPCPSLNQARQPMPVVRPDCSRMPFDRHGRFSLDYSTQHDSRRLLETHRPH